VIGPFVNKYRFLSNFFPCQVRLDGVMYPSVEHAYQAAKTLDVQRRVAILGCSTPGQAKRMGRTIGFRPDWLHVRLAVMKDLLTQKFSSGLLRDALVGTGEEELVEVNTWHDTFWGRYNGRGQNWLGRLLMEVRSELGSSDSKRTPDKT